MKNLIISSGYVNILSLLGGITYLNEKNILKDIKCYYGCSISSIIIVMLALNYTIEEIKDFIIKFNFIKLIGDYNFFNFINNYGFSLGENKDIIIQSIIIYKLGENNLNYTFKQLYEDKNIELNLFATCVEDNILWKFSHNTNENVPIWKALLASINIPIIFVPIKINNNNFIDGSVINNYPINYIPDNELEKTIGLYVEHIYKLDLKFLNLTENFDYYINTFFLHIIKKKNVNFINTIKITLPKDFDLYEFNFNICYDDKIKLINNGYNNTKKYFEEKNNSKLIINKIKKSNSCYF
jgi:predicted acylesterase/phospholipase RssA